MKITHRRIQAHADIPADEPKKPVTASGRYYVTPEITEMDLKLAAESVAKSLKKMEGRDITTEIVIDRLRSLSDFWDEYWGYGLRTREDEKEFLYDFLDRLKEYGVTDVIDDTFEDTIKGSVDTGLDYWYFSRHGMGPGTIPRDVQVLDWYEEGYKTWMKLDKMLTTEELNEYNVKEEVPPVGSITHNGDVVEACDKVMGSTDSNEFVDYDWFDFNAQEPEASELGRFRNRFYGDFLDSYDQKSVLDGWCYCVGQKADEEGLHWRSFTPKNWEIVKDMSDEDIYNNYPEAPLAYDVEGATDVSSATADDLDKDVKKKTDSASDVKKVAEDDNSITYVVSSEDENIEGMSLVNYKNYKIIPDTSFGGWNIFNKDRDLVKRGLETELDAKDYIDGITKDINNSTSVQSAIDVSNIDLEALKHEIEEGCLEYLCGPKGGFKRPGEPRESKWDMYADDMFVTEVSKIDNRIKVEVRAELSYSGMENMSDILDHIVKQYDEDAYFDMVEPGIMEAFIGDDDVYGSEDIEASKFDRWNDDVIRRHSDDVDPPDYEEEEYEDASSEFPFEIEVVVDNEGEPKIVNSDPLYHADILYDEGITEDEMNDNFWDVVEWHIPAEEGKYKIKGNANLVYEIDPYSLTYHFAPRLSTITDVDVVKTGKFDSEAVESSTDITSAMTEEDLDYAIENGKPFDIESFKKWKTPINPDNITAEKVEVGDVIKIDSAEEINNGTVVKVLSINDPAESWIDYTFKCEVLEHDGRMQDVEVGSIVYLHFFADEEVGSLVIE